MSDGNSDDPDDLPPTETFTVDAGSAKGIRKSRDKLERERQEDDNFWRAVLASQVGRRNVWRLLQDAHTFEDRFACGPNGFPQPDATWFQAGQKALGEALFFKLLKIDRDNVGRMLDEHDPRFAKRPGEV